ncbi:tail protein X [Thauera propionica]|uniref:tail protein X n=1 Tax=Thauera propionica TaxID=2019431 RepID=UPI0023F14CC2|nr:tail protein X [Thauera propionica]MDD3676029.1 tail protein X [Thauera propionica]
MTTQKLDSQVLAAREGEMLDALVWRHYGRVDVLPMVLEANRHLARLPVAQMLHLPAGTPVLMPALNDQPVLPLVRIWS